MCFETFYCSCGKDFDERKFLEFHQQKCPTIKELQEVDEDDDDDPEDQNQDLKENKPPKVNQFKCDKCDKYFGTTRSLYNHNRSVHPKCLYECATCGRTFKVKRILIRHEERANCKLPFDPENESLFYCSCGQGFDDPQFLDIHKRKCPTYKEIQEEGDHKDAKENNPPTSKLQEQNSYHPHKSHNQKSRPRHECQDCGKKFQSPCDLRRHSVGHTGEKPFSCETCNLRFTRKRNLKEHILRFHNQENVAFYECDQCGKKFPTPFTLQRHKLVHTGKKPFSCETCDSCFTQKVDLERHVLKFHLKKSRPTHECEDCGKKFDKPNQLRAHKVVHTGEKPFSCETCSKCYAYKSDLNKHILKHHRQVDNVKEKNPSKVEDPENNSNYRHECQDCGKKFPAPSKLQRHRIVHTGEKPFSCDTCSKCYFYKCDLNRHILKHHR